MKIAAGTLRGRTVRVPAGVRPTGGRAREALFAIWGPRLAGSRFLDLFAGSGAVGLEALSRGAAEVVAVESAPRVAALLRRNYERLAGGGEWTVCRLSLPAALSHRRLTARAPFDLIFADPPYAFDTWADLLAGIAPLLAIRGRAAVEHGRRNRPSVAAGLTLESRRTYGETELSFFRPGRWSPGRGETPAPRERP